MLRREHGVVIDLSVTRLVLECCPRNPLHGFCPTDLKRLQPSLFECSDRFSANVHLYLRWVTVWGHLLQSGIVSGEKQAHPRIGAFG